MASNDRVFLDYNRVQEFFDRCEIALFLSFYSNRIVYAKYIGHRCFEAMIGNRRVIVSLFGQPDIRMVQQYCVRNNEDYTQYIYHAYKLINRPSNVNEVVVEDIVFPKDFATEYRLWNKNNPVEYILANLFDGLRLINQAGLSEFTEIPASWQTNDVLYKYKSFPDRELKTNIYDRSKNLLQEFIDGSLTYTNPYKFNDPFDCDCEIPILNEIIRRLIEKVDKEKQKDIDADELTNHFENRFFEHDEEPFENITGEIKDTFVARGWLNEDKATEIIDNISSSYISIKKYFRVLCMSPHYDDILMWGYYGGFGSGLCGGFKKADIVDAFKEESNFILVSGKVFYSKDNNKPKYSGEPVYKYILKCVFTKSGIWEHEDETRYLLLKPKFNGDYYSKKTVCSERYLGVTADSADVSNFTFPSAPHKMQKDPSRYKLI